MRCNTVIPSKGNDIDCRVLVCVYNGYGRDIPSYKCYACAIHSCCFTYAHIGHEGYDTCAVYSSIHQTINLILIKCCQFSYITFYIVLSTEESAIKNDWLF